MESIIGLLKSASTSLSAAPKLDENSDLTKPTFIPQSTAMEPAVSRLESLPAEIITQIFAFLPAVPLSQLSQTSQLLRRHAHNDLLWMRFVRENIPKGKEITSPLPAQSWRHLFLSHHPYWFIPRHKIWFSDAPSTGMIILARYHKGNGCLEAYRLVAEHGVHHFEMWDYNPEVIIHTFNPRVTLWRDDPVVKIDLKDRQNGNPLNEELTMQTGKQYGICSMISLCQPIPQSRQYPSMALWPPAIVPQTHRVRNESSNKFRTDEHRPKTLADVSDRTFRIRRRVEFPNVQVLHPTRMGEDVMTFSTLLEENYTPTKEKPYQGIWVGDYSGHGCEFLLVRQRPVASGITLSRKSSTNSLPHGMSIVETEVETEVESIESSLAGELENAKRSFENRQSKGKAANSDPQELTSDEAISGRLEAIKLTGDPNVPRGEYTWIAEDIGPNGLLRIANEQMFVGARMVRSWGRIAGRGFRHDRFIPSQLILMSHNSIAQYWQVSQI